MCRSRRRPRRRPDPDALTQNLLSRPRATRSIGPDAGHGAGCFYIDADLPGPERRRATTSPTLDEATLAYQNGVIALQAPVRVRMPGVGAYRTPRWVACSSTKCCRKGLRFNSVAKSGRTAVQGEVLHFAHRAAALENTRSPTGTLPASKRITKGGTVPGGMKARARLT